MRIAARVTADRRRWRRVAFPVKARVMTPSGREIEGRILDISPGGVAVEAMRLNNALLPGQVVVVMAPGLGRLEVDVARVDGALFCGALHATRRKRDHLADLITWFINRRKLKLGEERRSPRLRRHKVTFVKLSDGLRARAQLLNIAEHGASVASLERPIIGEPVILDGRRARVMRLHRRGFAVQFDEPMPIAQVDEQAAAIENPPPRVRVFGALDRPQATV